MHSCVYQMVCVYLCLEAPLKSGNRCHGRVGIGMGEMLYINLKESQKQDCYNLGIRNSRALFGAIFACVREWQFFNLCYSILGADYLSCLELYSDNHDFFLSWYDSICARISLLLPFVPLYNYNSIFLHQQSQVHLSGKCIWHWQCRQW